MYSMRIMKFESMRCPGCWGRTSLCSLLQIWDHVSQMAGGTGMAIKSRWKSHLLEIFSRAQLRINTFHTNYARMLAGSATGPVDAENSSLAPYRCGKNVSKLVYWVRCPRSTWRGGHSNLKACLRLANKAAAVMSAHSPFVNPDPL